MVEVKKFWAEWCGPCHMLAPMINELKIEYPNVSFIEINVDRQSHIAEQYGIRSIPAVVIEKDGTEIQRFVGVQSKMAYSNAINENLKL